MSSNNDDNSISINRTRVKICGITRKEDAQACVTAGADALGLVFYPDSPRSVSLTTAAEILSSLPAFVTTVGLFVNANSLDVQSVLAQIPLDCLQFHGDESPDFCEQFKRPYIKAIRVSEQTDLPVEAERFNRAQALLLDTYIAGIPGGTGQTFNWQLIPKKLSKPIILAGGLTPANVGEAIKTVAPYAVDVSGGVEASKGIKDKDKIKQFIHEVQCIGTTE